MTTNQERWQMRRKWLQQLLTTIRVKIVKVIRLITMVVLLTANMRRLRESNTHFSSPSSTHKSSSQTSLSQAVRRKEQLCMNWQQMHLETPLPTKEVLYHLSLTSYWSKATWLGQGHRFKTRAPISNYRRTCICRANNSNLSKVAIS